jgi:hypothetical protein
VIPHLGTVLPLLGKYWKPVGIAFAVGAILGFWLGWRIHRPVSIRETAAPAIALPSGAIIAERVPDAPLPPVAKEAAKHLGGKVARAGSVTIQARAVQAGMGEAGNTAGSNAGDVGSNPTAGNRPPSLLSTLSNSTQPQSLESGERDNLACSCEPVRVDWSLIGLPDGSSRMAFASDATILEASDTPAASTRYSRQTKWAVGGLVEFTSDGDRRYGAWVDRDLGPFRVGVEASHGRGGVAAELRAGITF